MSNESSINWTAIVMGGLLFLVGLSIPSPFTRTPNIKVGPMDSTIVAVPGIPDTVISEGQTYRDRVTDTVYVAMLPDIPIYVEVKIDTILAGGTKVHIRGTTYFNKVKNEENEDSLLVIPTIEWNITERPARTIFRIDTTKTYYPVIIEYKAAWFNKPEVVIPTTSLLTTILMLIILL